MLTRICCPRSIGIASLIWEFLSPTSTIVYCVELLVSYFILKGARDFWFEDLMSERRKLEASCPRALQGRENCGVPIAPKTCCRPNQETTFSNYSPSNASAPIKTPLHTSIYSATQATVRGPLSMASSQGQYPNTFTKNHGCTGNCGNSLGRWRRNAVVQKWPIAVCVQNLNGLGRIWMVIETLGRRYWFYTQTINLSLRWHLSKASHSSQSWNWH